MSLVVVITGSTKGIGLGLAEQFLKRGHRVMISSRTKERVDAIVEALQCTYPDQVEGMVTDVVEYDSVEQLAKYAVETWGHIDIWVNNAGMTDGATKLHEVSVDRIAQTVSINVTGHLYGCRAALNVMLNQDRMGRIFNMAGFGSKGQVQDFGLTTYSTTKRSIPHISKALSKQYKNTNVKISTISPGMVATDLLEGSDRYARIFNIIADPVELPTDYLVEKMIKSKKTNEYLDYYNRWKIIGRFLRFRAMQNRIYDEQGNFLITKIEDRILETD